MNDELRGLIDLDRVIHEPARLLITAVLQTVESADFLYLLHATELTKGNLSSHLMRLEKAGYVAIEKVFEGKMPRTICRLTNAGREAFETYREQMKAAI
ncbi:MAG: ArsR family transcriptional regulator [Chloroflexi bacterium]|nr:ArsR family transcriptional regulator [Chloroflexota bacterium]